MPVTLGAGDRLGDAVYERIREQIFAGDLAAGMRLSVPALATRLDVSRSPVRDAVLRLTQEGLAREEPRRGAVVVRITASDLAALYEVREVLEGLATRLAVENAGRRLVDNLAGVLARHEKAVRASDLDGHFEADTTFHRLIREASGNAEVCHMLDRIGGKVRLAMRTTAVTAGPRYAVRDHKRILAAIRRGDPGNAEAVARAHIARLRTALAEAAGDAR